MRPPALKESAICVAPDSNMTVPPVPTVVEPEENTILPPRLILAAGPVDNKKIPELPLIAFPEAIPITPDKVQFELTVSAVFTKTPPDAFPVPPWINTSPPTPK